MSDHERMPRDEEGERGKDVPAPEGLKARTQPEREPGKGRAGGRSKTDEIVEDVNEDDRRELEEARRRNLGTPNAPDS